jgi:hypothetical protein
MKSLIFRWIKPLVDALITERINLFHDALVERRQIKTIQETGYRPVGVSLPNRSSRSGAHI